jgi:hypothetical protein
MGSEKLRVGWQVYCCGSNITKFVAQRRLLELCNQALNDMLQISSMPIRERTSVLRMDERLKHQGPTAILRSNPI